MSLPCLAFFDDAFYLSILPRHMTTTGVSLVPPQDDIMMQVSSADAAVENHHHHHQKKKKKKKKKNLQILNFQLFKDLRLLQILVVFASSSLLLSLSLPGASWLATGDHGNAPQWSLALQRRVQAAGLDVGNLYNSGRFAHVTRQRNEIIIWALHCSPEQGQTDGGVLCSWHELDIPCKPGSVDRSPCITAPFHRRLSWQFWFLALGHDRGWYDSYLQKLARFDGLAWEALEPTHPFLYGERPYLIMSQAYRYKFSDIGGQTWAGGKGSEEGQFRLRHINELRKGDGGGGSKLKFPPEKRRVGSWWQREHLGRFSDPLYVDRGEVLHP